MRRSMRRSKWLLPVALAAALLTVACTGGDAQPSAAPAQPNDASSVAATVEQSAPTNDAAPEPAPVTPLEDTARTQIDGETPTAVAVAVATAAPPDPPTQDATQPETETAASAAEPAAEPAPPPPKLVVLDPGHGGDDPGAATNGVVERESNLDLALRVEALLQTQGIRVILTRRGQEGLVPVAANDDLPSFALGRADRQARVDLANDENADLFIAIHSTGAIDVNTRGVEVWYDPNREFGDNNIALAELLLAEVVAELRAFGHDTLDRGIRDDTCWRISQRDGSCFPLFVLAPAREIDRARLESFGIDPAAFGFEPGQQVLVTRATNMPAALLELLFISNEADALLLRNDPSRDAIARGIANAVLAYFDMDADGTR